MSTMQGRRITWQDAENLRNTKPGDYWLDPEHGWYAACPDRTDEDGLITCLAWLRSHTVTEHEDGTITVSPSIFVGGSGYPPETPSEWVARHTWHGWLERGIWRDA